VSQDHHPQWRQQTTRTGNAIIVPVQNPATNGCQRVNFTFLGIVVINFIAL
jgi:hypothetical protein